MAHFAWGNVYFNAHFAGCLREEPGNRASFTYDACYLNAGLPALAFTLPLKSEPFISELGLHPFFDNLVAEGWLEAAQTRLLGKRQASRFELLLAFGQDCAGAVSVIDPEPAKFTRAMLDETDQKELVVMASRASLSGIQPKLTLIHRDGKFMPSKKGELSTHIAKFQSRHHDDLVMNEYLTTLAFKALVLDDDVADMWLGEVDGFSEQALIIKRFDRDDSNTRIHFEEFNQLLGNPSKAKYDGSYKDIADFIRTTSENGASCSDHSSQIYRLYLRILAGLLIGNTDMHLKNFAMFHTPTGLRLTPSYDQLASSLYQYKSIALAIGGAHELSINMLKPKNIIKLGEEFKLSSDAIALAYEQLSAQKKLAKESIAQAEQGSELLKNQLINIIEKRWVGTFALVEQQLLKK